MKNIFFIMQANKLNLYLPIGHFYQMGRRLANLYKWWLFINRRSIDRLKIEMDKL